MSARAVLPLATLVLLGNAALARADEADYANDSDGRRLRVAFDPGKRAYLGAAHAPILEGDAADVQRAAFEGGLSYRHVVDFDDEGIRWKLQHDLLSGMALLGGGAPEMRGELYSLSFLRWSKDGGIVLPTSPPRRIDMPFGVGFELGLGSVDVRTGGSPRGEVGVARGALLVDLAPRRTPGTAVTVGAGPRYDVRFDVGDDGTTVDHVVVPFSQPELAVRVESSDGHHHVAARGGGGYAWSQRDGATAGARASARWETIVLAVNDLPVSVGADVRWRWDAPPRAGFAAHEIAAIYGLRFGLPLD